MGNRKPTDPDEQIPCIRFVRSWFRYERRMNHTGRR